MRFDMYCDPAHGWLKVPRDLLEELGAADKISKYSYQRQNHVYLEEDLDMGIFMDAYKTKTGKDVKIVPSHSNKLSKIRSYQRYAPGSVFVTTCFNKVR